MKVETQNDSNTSDHISVTIAMKLIVATIDVIPVVVGVKPKWDKCNMPLYTSHISRQLHPFNSPITDFEFVLSFGRFASTLKNAVRASNPGQKDSRKIHPAKDRVLNENISFAVKQYKAVRWQWKAVGCPENCEHPLV